MNFMRLILLFLSLYSWQICYADNFTRSFPAFQRVKEKGNCIISTKTVLNSGEVRTEDHFFTFKTKSQCEKAAIPYRQLANKKMKAETRAHWLGL